METKFFLIVFTCQFSKCFFAADAFSLFSPSAASRNCAFKKCNILRADRHGLSRSIH